MDIKLGNIIFWEFMWRAYQSIALTLMNKLKKKCRKDLGTDQLQPHK
jgi:hypothetical protein